MPANEPEPMAKNLVTLSDLTFTLPSSWEVESVENGEAKIQVPDSSNTVIIPLSVQKAGNVKMIENSFITETPSGAKTYREACVPSLYCSYVVTGGVTYLVTFAEPMSDEVAPENVEGPWFPKTEVTDEQMVAVINSVIVLK